MFFLEKDLSNCRFVTCFRRDLNVSNVLRFDKASLKSNVRAFKRLVHPKMKILSVITVFSLMLFQPSKTFVDLGKTGQLVTLLYV